MRKTKQLLAGMALMGCITAASATPVSITFDVAQAAFTPNAPAQIAISNQFESLGLQIWDVEHNQAASVGDCTGGVGSDPYHLYGASSAIGSSGCGDTTPSLDFLFVDPTNSSNSAYTTAFSLEVTDGHTTTLTAYDLIGNVLGSAVTTGGFGERIGVSGIGDIYRVNVTTPSNATAYDDLLFESVISSVQVPEPGTLALLGLGLAGLGLARRKKT